MVSASHAPPFDLQIQVWREVCRHLHIAESCATIAEMLGRYLPLRALAVRRLFADGAVAEVVGVSESGLDSGVSVLHAQVLETARRFCRSGSPVWLLNREAAAEWLGALVPVRLNGPLWVIGLHSAMGIDGALILQLNSQEASEPFDLTFLREPFSAALENDWRLHELTALKEAAEADRSSLLRKLGRQKISDDTIGRDKGLRSVFERIATAAPLDIPILILGETGTGKEVVARAMHDQSSRSSGPFIRVNCGAIPQDLIDSELFGHEKGSFTGAANQRKGWFERADHGTLLLDEIGELPLQAQVRLLRVLQEGTLTRVGGEQPIHVNVRILSSTHRDLLAMVQQGTFREDLWYRLAVFPILLPPLRDRSADLPDLARHFARKASLRFGLPIQTPKDEDIEILASYNWPGNVRELQTVIDRAAILGNGEGLEIRRALGVLDQNAHARPAPPATSGQHVLCTLDDAIRDQIETTLRHTHGRVSGHDGAAEILGEHPNTLRAKMQKLKVNPAKFRDRD